MILRIVEHAILFESEDSMYLDILRKVQKIPLSDLELVKKHQENYQPLGLFVGLFGYQFFSF